MGVPYLMPQKPVADGFSGCNKVYVCENGTFILTE